MNAPGGYTALGPGLFDGSAWDECRASVILPARNEEALLPRALDALRDQHDLENKPLNPHSYEVLVFLNNCTDASSAVAERYQRDYPEFQLHVAMGELPPEQAHVGTARRRLMDAAYQRVRKVPGGAILSTDADTVVAPDWIARNLAALDEGADVVGGVIHLFPADLSALRRDEPGVALAYGSDRELQALVAQLEALLDPDPADPWPRHLEHFGASLACTPEIYARAGGLPPVKPLEDVAFIDALRKIGARIRHCPDTHIFTSARLDGRAEVGLSGQLRHWQKDVAEGLAHMVDSAEWMEHRFQSLAWLRCMNRGGRGCGVREFPASWRARIAELRAQQLETPRFLELLDCDALIEETFQKLRQPRHGPIEQVLAKLRVRMEQIQTAELMLR